MAKLSKTQRWGLFGGLLVLIVVVLVILGMTGVIGGGKTDANGKPNGGGKSIDNGDDSAEDYTGCNCGC